MKRKLLMAAFAAMVGLSSHAQLTDGTVYWLQDASTGEFISQGENWGTRATVQDVGGVGFQAVFVSDGVYKLKNIMWNKVNNADLGLRVTDGYCDQPASDVTLTPSGEGYLVGIAGGNYLCNNQAENDYGVKKLGLSTEPSAATVWKFLTKTEYDAAIQAYKDKKAASFATSLGLSATSVSALEAILATDYITKDYTSSITNATLNAGNTDGWTAIQPNQRNQAFGSQNGTMAEAWNGCVVATQDVSGLPTGLYKVTFVGTFRPKGNADSEKLTSEQTSSPAYVFANDAKEEFIHWIDVSAKANDRAGVKNNAAAYTSSFYTYVTNGSLKLGVKQDTWYDGNMWCPFGYFTLTYYSNEVSDEDATAILSDAETLEGKKMNVDVKSALTSAKNTFDGARTIANYNALNTAMTNANACVTAYAGAKAFFDEVDEVLANTNVYTAESYATYYTEPKAKYEANTLTTEEASALVKTSTGNRVANTLDDILLSTWTIGGQQAKDYTKGLYINTWSTEGNTDGSEFKTPFFEYWVWDTNSLEATNLVSTMTGLKPNTDYSFTIRARVRQTNDKTKIAEGITMKVGEGTAVDISAGAQFNNGTFYIGNFSAMGKTDADGKLTTTITVAENSNISWLSFYNCNYTEGEDLSAYIADYEFALSTAQTNIANTAYAAITGKEKADLQAAITTYASVDNTDKAALIAAKEALETASNAFVNAAYDYTTLEDLNENVATKLGVAWPTVTETTTAADINAKDIVVAEVTAAKAYPTDVTDKLGAWSATPNPDQHGESWDGTTTDKYYDSWNGETTMTQTVTLPQGDYALIFKCRASTANVNVTDGTNTVRFAHKGNTGRGIATDGTATFADGATYARNGAGQGWEYRVLTFTSDGTTATTLTFNWNTKPYLWAGLDDIELRANLSVLDYSKLQTAYDDAVANHVFGFDAGEYAPYNNVGNAKAIADAKAVLDAQNSMSQAAIDAVETSIKNLTWTANTTEVNGFYDGFFTIQTVPSENTRPLGWARNSVIANTNNGSDGGYETRLMALPTGVTESNVGMMTKFHSFYGDQESYSLPLNADTYYTISFKHAGWGNQPEMHVNVYSADGTRVAQSNNFTATNGGNTDASKWKEFNYTFKTTTAGNYVIGLIKNVGGTDQNQAAFTELQLFTAATASFTVNSDVKYGTFCAPFDVAIPSGVTAYKVEDVESDAELKLEEVTTIEANKPVLLYAENGYNTTTVYGKAVAAENVKNGLLTGVYAETDAPVGSYVLQYLNDKAAFYKVADGAQLPKVGANRAYLTLPSNAAAPRAIFIDGEATGISAYDVLTSGQYDGIYTANGVQIPRLQKGVNILKKGNKTYKIYVK